MAKQSTQDKDRPISELGRDLRAISEKIAASGERPLIRREMAREVAERRGATLPTTKKRRDMNRSY